MLHYCCKANLTSGHVKLGAWHEQGSGVPGVEPGNEDTDAC